MPDITSPEIQTHYINQMGFLESILSQENVTLAYKSVWQNKGCAGVDGIGLDQFLIHLTKNWKDIKNRLLRGDYLPDAILGQEIEKESGGIRLLGIPTTTDRLIQQSIHQFLQPLWDGSFSKYSYGFRPNRNAGMAILQAQQYINNGYNYIVDIDLKSFFDKVNHDYLMSLIKQKVKDAQLLQLIWKYLRSPILIGGKLHKRTLGVPQGGPLSPLLSNIVLNELDKELETRGLRFVRYADDFSIFTRSRKASVRVKHSVTKFVKDKLHLQVNETKSKVCRPLSYEYLGYAFVSSYAKGVKGKYQLVVSKSKLHKFKQKLKRLTRKTIPMSFDERISRVNLAIRGWINYFKFASIHGKLKGLDSWLRKRLRYCIWSR